MDKGELDFMSDLRSAIRKWIVGGIGSLILVLIGFYFNTQYTLSSYEERFERLEKKVSSLEVDVKDMDPAALRAELTTVRFMIEDMQARMIASDKRQDKMYDIMIDMANKR